jgi:hypothetical protein
MRLNFDSFEFDAKGLPRVFSLRVSPSYTGEGPVTVSILLDSCRRAAVAKWAARLGVEVADLTPYQSRPGDRWTHTYEAVLEDKACRVRVWTSLDLDAPAEPAGTQGPAAPVCLCGCPAGGPCGCVTSYCPCNPCPVCDRDGGQ